ncbi:fumarylacetoacetate hydrolase family protein [Pseudonocardia nematodicida]|uniref:Fumarylacetoacetate hydrolase family protein n=1 Tax=Pseudonocardia nematodicida TaxID=1206997 RepID=A0ABV1KE08_9PSEU
MRLATVDTANGTRTARIENDYVVLLDAPDLSSLLNEPDWEERARSDAHQRVSRDRVRIARLLSGHPKIICVGLNYRGHITEIGLPTPDHPALFGKFPEALLGPADDLALPTISQQVDWEAELAVVIGSTARHADAQAAADAIAGFTVANDVSMRDLQNRTTQWLQGKTFEATTPIGPVLVTPDELPGGVTPDLRISCMVGGETVQDARTSDLLFSPVDLVAYVSRILTLNPADVILTGTPAGVGTALEPPRFLSAGELLVTEIEHIGRLENRIVA